MPGVSSNAQPDEMPRIEYNEQDVPLDDTNNELSPPPWSTSSVSADENAQVLASETIRTRVPMVQRGDGWLTKLKCRRETVQAGASRINHKSEWHMIAGLPWRIAARSEHTSRSKNVPTLGVYVNCNSESLSTLWSCKANATITLVPKSELAVPIVRTFSKIEFNYNRRSRGFASFVELERITDESNGYITDDGVIIEAQIRVYEVSGARVPRNYEFNSTSPPLADVMLRCHDGVVYVNKTMLALNSPYFNRVFYENSKESTQDEITLVDIDYQDLRDLLSLIYPTRKEPDGENVASLLKWADKYQMERAIDECARFLINTSTVSVVRKLHLADMYGLHDVQDAALQSLKSSGDVKALQNFGAYEQLSDATKSALLDVVLKFVRK